MIGAPIFFCTKKADCPDGSHSQVGNDPKISQRYQRGEMCSGAVDALAKSMNYVGISKLDPQAACNCMHQKHPETVKGPI